jgi:hypothetical protein
LRKSPLAAEAGGLRPTRNNTIIRPMRVGFVGIVKFMVDI